MPDVTPPQADPPPRKVIVATTCLGIAGNPAERAETIAALIADIASESRRRFGHGPDLVVMPEFALTSGQGGEAAARCLRADDPAVAAIAEACASAGTWLVLPMALAEGDSAAPRFANAALLLDRTGERRGIYRKAYPVADADGVFEGGVTPGEAMPVFETDFGKLGVLICWDMAYDAAWSALADGGAELIALPSASPQTVRPAACAQRHRLWVATATPRDNATIFNPIGLADARIEPSAGDPTTLVHRFDLASAVVHWSEAIEEGRAFERRFGGAGGYTWSEREDTGLFWSNDPAQPIGTMLRAIGAETMDAQRQRIADAVRDKKPTP